jgi:lipoprotein-releasing system permease protein
LNLEYYIAKRITFRSERTFSKTIIRIAILAIALSVATMLISISIVNGFQSEIKNKLIGFNSHIQVSHTKVNYTFENEPVIVDGNFIRSVKNLPEVANIQTFITKPAIIRANNEIEGMVLKGVGNDFSWDYMRSVLQSGRILQTGDTVPPDEMIISSALAKKLNLKLGDKATLYFIQQPPRARRFEVCGLYETSIEDVDNVFALCDIRHLQKVNNWDSNQAGGYEISLTDFNTLQESNDKIRLLAPMGQDSRTIKENYPQIFDWLNLLDVNVQIILLLMAVVASVNMITALLVIILEKTQFIGILKSIGAENTLVSRVFIYNAVFLIGSGILTGDIIGLILMSLQYYFHFLKLPPESYSISYIPVDFAWGQFILLNIGTLAFCTLVMYLPSRIVAKISPVKTIRFE